MNLKDKIYFQEPVMDRFYNGFSENETVVLRFDGKVGVFTIRNMFTLTDPAERLVAKEEDIWLKDIPKEKPMEVLGKTGFVKVQNIIRRRVYEPLFVVKTESGKKTVVSASHQIPVLRNEEEVLVRADNLKVGDLVFVKTGKEVDNPEGKFEKIVSVEKETKQHLSVYGLLTETGGAIISGIFQKAY